MSNFFIDLLRGENHDTIINICFLYCIGYRVIIEPCIEVFHLIAKLLNIIDDDECIRSTLWQTEEKIVEILSLHRIDIYTIKIPILESGNNFFCISPYRMDIFDFTVFEMFYGFDMRIPCIFDSGDNGGTF